MSRGILSLNDSAEFDLGVDNPFSPYCSDNEGADRLPMSSASDGGLCNLESDMDQALASMLKQKANLHEPQQPTGKRKRGRKPLRPHDPVKKKTEEKDKYWLRAFRAYMKIAYSKYRTTMSPQERSFWEEHLGEDGKPEKGRKYLSYGQRYKNYLFSHLTFAHHFKRWFDKHGQAELLKKCTPDSGLWIVFYNYASEELINYAPRGCSSLNGSESPLSCASPIELEPQVLNVDEFFMILDEEHPESFLRS